MKKIFLLFILLSVFSIKSASSQFLHIGAKAFASPFIIMTYYEYDVTDYVYYFSNDMNETIRFSGFSGSLIKSYVPFPTLYTKINLGNHFYFELDFYFMWFTNEAKFKNSVDFSEYSGTFNEDSEFKNLGYNSIKLKWRFWGNSLKVGFIFRKAKTWRPYLYTGINTLRLSSLKPGDYYEDTRAMRNEMIFNNLSTFKKRTWYLLGGLGIKYYALNFEIFSMSNIGIIDKNDANYGIENTRMKERPNYQRFLSVNMAIGINLFSFNLKKNKIKK